jgi:hypothetical protein
MLQRYTLRLGDGTVLQVDIDGLRVWETDARAAVHVAGTQDWRPLREFLAEEESAARLARALVPPEPRRPTPPAVEPAPPGPADEVAIGEPPMVQALAEEPRAPAPPWREPEDAAGDAVVLRLKPLDEEISAPYAVPRAPARRAEDAEEDEGRPQDRLEGPLLQVVATLGNVLSRCLDPLTPLVSRWTSRSHDEPAPRPPATRSPQPPPRPPSLVLASSTAVEPSPTAEPSAEEPPTPEAPPAAAPTPQVSVLAEDPGAPVESFSGAANLPVIRQRPPDDDGRRETSASLFSETLAVWVAGLPAGVARASRWVVGLPERLGRGTSAPAAPRAPRQAPAPAVGLPVLRFRETDDAPEGGDVYEGQEEGESLFPVLWLWIVRVALVAGVVTVGVLAALRWEAWFPRAAEVGQSLFTEIDRQAHSGERAREREQALADATARLPHLAPPTIRLVLSTTSTGVLDPPEVFQIAREAADRGRSSLAPAEAAELRSLERELLANLRPPQRARLDEYDRARASRVVFPFENPHALDLVALGARALPPASRARLQDLLGKAVAAGLVPPGDPPRTDR